jgi:5-oxoprolinase (ATP-hydrolysing)
MGGGDAQTGVNLWIKNERGMPGPRAINLGGKQTVKMSAGDRIIINTPGGGAWGAVGDTPTAPARNVPNHHGPRGSLAERKAAWEGSS